MPPSALLSSFLPRTLRARLLVTIGLLFSAILGLLALALLHGLPGRTGILEELLTNELQHLEAAADQKKALLEGWLQDRRRLLAFLAEKREVVEATQCLAAACSDREVRWARLDETLGLTRARLRLHAIQLLDAGEGRLLAGLPAQPLLRLRQQVIAAATPGDEESMLVLRGAVGEGPLLLLIRQVAVVPGGRPSALLVAAIATDESLTPLLTRGAGERLGSSEDAYLVSAEFGLLTAPRLHEGSLGDASLQRQLLGSPVVQLAIGGDEGASVSTDYRGEPVLAAYRHLRLAPDLGFGLVVKQDEAEVLAPARRIAWLFGAVIPGSLVLVLLATLLLSQGLTGPIRELVGAASRISTGDLTARARVASLNDLGELALTFNGMAERLGAWHEHLEQELGQRTADLRAERNAAQRYLDVAGVVLVVLNTDGRVRLINRLGCELLGYPNEEIVGRDWFEHFIPPGDRDAVRERFESLCMSGADPTGLAENELLTRDGRRRLMAWRNALLRDEEGHVTATLSSGEDVTERRRLEAQLQRMATHDPLTQTLNRGHFMELAKRELARAYRAGSPTGLIMLDIDHFKAVNDTYGHAAGDEVLRSVTEACGTVLRHTDLFGRFGGEEFVALLPDGGLAAARAIAERLRQLVAEKMVLLPEGPVGVTLSAGVVEVREGENLERLLARADRALYQAKAEGRNRVCAA